MADAPAAVPVASETFGDGPPLLLVAGTGYPGATWPPSTRKAFGEHFTVITFDHRGTGSTPGTPGAYTTRLFARDALALLESLGFDSAHVLGHSMGGRVAQWMALDAPQRVRSLVLISTGAGEDPGHHPRPSEIAEAVRQSITRHGYETYIRDLQRRTFFTEEFAAEHDDDVEWLWEAFWRDRPALSDYLKHVVARQEHDTTARLGEIGQPALVVVGNRDTHEGMTGNHLRQAQYLAERLPRAELVLIPGAKHGVFWEKPDETNGAVARWLSEVA